MNSILLMLVIVSTIINYANTAISGRPYLSNLSRDCLRCLCHAASGCDLSSPYECTSDGRCGPFRLAYAQWQDAGRPAPESHNARPGAEPDFTDCAADYRCAEHVVIRYIELHGRDCNGDRVTDCDDYLLINAHGATPCYRSLNRTSGGRDYLRRYRVCRPS